MNQRTGWIDAATRVCVAFVLLCGLAWHSAAESVEQPAPTIELGTPFTDGAILQRDMPAKVWGWTEMFAKVTVSFAGQTKEAVADADGKWTVQLDPLEASATPSVLKVRAAIDREGTVLETQVEDLLVGEVWVASGQSNMQWLASKCDVGRLLQAGIVERVEAGEEPAPIIRETKVTDVFSALHPIERATGEWIDDGAQMSAIAYAFAYELWKELGVPIGIVNCSFSSTQIEAWTPREGFVGSDQPYTQSIEAQLRLTDPNTPEHRAAWSGYFASLRQAIEDNQKRVANGQPAEAIDLPPPGNLSNNRAVAADDRFLATIDDPGFYTSAVCHNWHLLMFAAMLSGRRADADRAVAGIEDLLQPEVLDVPEPHL
ncbi:MAG: sialate O-acetylesterase, partial [Phycisphaeraceae bacterium]